MPFASALRSQPVAAGSRCRRGNHRARNRGAHDDVWDRQRGALPPAALPRRGRLAMLYLERRPRANRRGRNGGRSPGSNSAAVAARLRGGASTRRRRSPWADERRGARVCRANLDVFTFRSWASARPEDACSARTMTSRSPRHRWRSSATGCGRNAGTDPAIVRTTRSAQRRSFDVIGVLPPGFAGLYRRAEVWIPRNDLAAGHLRRVPHDDQNFISAWAGCARMSSRCRSSELAVLAPRSIARCQAIAVPAGSVTANRCVRQCARVDKTVRRSLFVLLGGVALLHLRRAPTWPTAARARGRQAARVSSAWRSGGSSAAGLFAHWARGSCSQGWARSLGSCWLVDPRCGATASAWRNFYAVSRRSTPTAFLGRELAFGAGLIVATRCSSRWLRP